MKKNFLFILCMVLSLFCFLPNAKASAKVELKENANGQIGTSIHFEEGFVGGIEISLAIKGNVDIDKFTFGSVVKSGYTKKSSYDPKTKVLTLIVTTGGVGTGHNLLNKNKELVLGTMYFTTKEKADTKYSLEVKKIVITDNTWNSKTLEGSLKEEGDFTYRVNSPQEPPKEEDSNTNTNTDTNSNTNTNSNTSSNSSNTNTNTSSNQTNTSSSNSSNSMSNTNTNGENTSSNTDTNSNEIESNTNMPVVTNSNTSQNSSTTEEKKETKKSSLLPKILIPGVGVVLIATAVAVVWKKKKA